MSSALKKNIAFVQLSDPDGIKAVSALFAKAPTKTPGQLFMLMMRLMDRGNGLIASQTILANRLGVSRPTLAAAVKYLAANKYIAVFKSGASNVYTLNASLVWKDYGYKKVEAELDCKVLLALDEQPDDVQRSARQMSIPMPDQCAGTSKE